METQTFRVRPGDRTALTRIQPDQTGHLLNKAAARDHLRQSIVHLQARLELLHAQGEHALLLVFQGMDASGKDGAIKHVMSGVNPIFTEVHGFKQPSDEELAHDYLWRAAKALPARGRIGIFDRSYYEDVIVVRVHPEILAEQRLPPERVGARFWEDRFEDIRSFERHLWRNGTTVRKFFFHVSRDEQRQRLLERFDDPEKNWKFSARDVRERAKWDQYQAAYRETLAGTSTEQSPWYVVPADRKWFARLLVAEIVIETLDQLRLVSPTLSIQEKRDLAQVRRQLAEADAARPAPAGTGPQLDVLSSADEQQADAGRQENASEDWR